MAATLNSPHAHRVDCFSEVGHTALELVLSRDGFAGWAGPDPVRSLTGSGSSGTPTSHGARQFVTGPWSLLPRLILSWAGVAPVWAGWPPLRGPARLIEDRLSGDRLHTGGTADVAEELGHWWLVRLSGIGPGAEPWLISERRGCMVVTGDSSSEDVTLVQVNSLSMLTAVVSYWDAALAGLATEGR
ncbi:hypothetical protein ACFFX0_07275 [Citricoccus parietis]|uniref:SMI1/KNR4 family protein n=1 Tax=Citricoccus parietis TaxID=592307 RepID=A0ABV5FWI6_9MICC